MQYTPLQKKVLREKGYCKVNYRDMWRNDHQLGYCSKGFRQYDVNVAVDVPVEGMTDVVLLHEVGHIFYGHVDSVDQKKEFKDLEAMCKASGRSFENLCVAYGGPHNFLNICMDLQINTTILNQGNVDLMKSQGVNLCIPEAYDIELQDTFRDYYQPLIDKLPTEEEFQKNKQEAEEMMQKLKDMAKKMGPNQGMQDLPSDGNMGMDSDISDAIKDAVRKSNYTDGNAKAAKDNIRDDNSGKPSTVNDAVDKNDVKNDPSATDDGSENKSAGNSKEAGKNIEIGAGNANDDVVKFLQDIVHVKQGFQRDLVKIYNRGSRPNSDGILYPSMKRTHMKKKVKLGILVDVSGSMNTDAILKAAQSIKDADIDPDSVFVTWNDGKVEEYNIEDLPNNIRTGGGTSMHKGLKYLVDEGMRDIVIYSDFETPEAELIEEGDKALREGCKLYSIIVANKGRSKETYDRFFGDRSNSSLRHYFNDMCTKNIVVDAN